MSSAVWLVSDFVSTPFALKQQLGIPPLPLLATCVRLMMMSSQNKKNVLFHCMHPQIVYLRRKYAFLFSQTGRFHTRNNKLHLFFYVAPSLNHAGCVIATSGTFFPSIFSFMNLFCSMNRRAVILLD
jgi:hypothetical protein